MTYTPLYGAIHAAIVITIFVFCVVVFVKFTKAAHAWEVRRLKERKERRAIKSTTTPKTDMFKGVKLPIFFILIAAGFGEPFAWGLLAGYVFLFVVPNL